MVGFLRPGPSCPGVGSWSRTGGPGRSAVHRVRDEIIDIGEDSPALPGDLARGVRDRRALPLVPRGRLARDVPDRPHAHGRAPPPAPDQPPPLPPPAPRLPV